MSVLRTQVFIASRFGEFAEVRNHLRERIDSFKVFPIETIDFNDGRVSSQPPLVNCINAIKESELMILLVGESYGSLPPGEELSFTHLEYRTAVGQESNTTVIPFFVGKSYQGKTPPFSPDPLLDAWQREILDNHTPGFLNHEEPPHILAEQIFMWAWKHLHDARDKTVQREMQLQRQIEAAVEEPESATYHDVLSGLPSEDVAFLEGRLEEGDSTEAVFQDGQQQDFPTLEELLRNPAAVAAQEQLAEARKAIGFGERAIAIRHLKRALEHRPLDIWASYTLAQLLMQSGRKNDCREAFEIASRAGKMALHDRRKVRSADCFILAAKAANKAGDVVSGMSSAENAVEVTPWLASAHIELACQFASDNKVQEAVNKAMFAFQLQPTSMQRLLQETQFIERPKLAREVVATIGTMVETWMRRLTGCYLSGIKLAQSIGVDYGGKRWRPNAVGKASGPAAVASECRVASLECLHLLMALAGRLQDMHDEECREKCLQSYKSSLELYRLRPGYTVTHRLRQPVEATLVDHIPTITAVDKGTPILTDKKTQVVCYSAPSDGVVEKYDFVSGEIVAVHIYQYSLPEEPKTQAMESFITPLKGLVASFCRTVSDYERALNSSQCLMPAHNIHRARVGDLVRLDQKQVSDREGFEIDRHLLPERMLWLVEEELFPMQNRFHMLRVIDTSAGVTRLSRCGTYF